MIKSNYYVSVQAGTILADQGAASYEFEILASREDLDELEELFKDRAEAEDGTYIRAHLPAVPYHIDDENDIYDASLQAVYAKLYECGTDETKRHIERMNILNE
jgi:lactam utilization protein B